jgi:hypothetical protein
MVDILLLNGFTDPMPLLWHLHKNGYEFITSTVEVAQPRGGTTNDYSTLSCFFIRKTRPTLDLPLKLLLIEDSKGLERVGYSWNEKLIDSQIDYQDQNFLLKISDNEWVQALAIQRILHLDPQLITNNTKFSAEIGKIILEEQAEKIAIPKYFDRNEKNLFLNHNIRAGFTPFEIDNVKEMCQCTTFETHNNYDAYGFKPIHLAVRLDNLQLFEYLMDLYPQMLEEKTLNQLAMTPFELATYYHMHTKGNKIYDFLHKYNTELLQQPNVPKNSGSIGPFFQNPEAGSETRKSEDIDQKIRLNMALR